MLFDQREFKRLLVAGLVLIGLPLAASANPMGTEEARPGCHEVKHSAPELGRGVTPPPFLAGLKLSEEQQDKVFEVMHDAAPAMRETAKAVHHAAEELRKAGFAEAYDAGKLRQLSEASGRAMADMLVLRSKIDHRIYALLTADQRKEAEARMKKFEAHEGGPGRLPF